MRFAPTPWSIAALAFVVLGFSRGLHSSFGVFYVALLETFSWSRGATAGVFSFVLAVDAILSPVVGYLLDRHGPKKIVTAGCLTLAGGLLLTSQVQSLWQLYFFFGLVCAVGFTFTGMVPHVFLVSEWFSSNRASAIGVVYAGSGVGILLLAPLSEWRAVIFSALTADIFSGKGFGSILGYSTVAVGVGGALGSWLGGALHDWTGTYLVSFALSSVVLAGSDVCIWLAAIPWVAGYDQRLWARKPD